jgi:hypothetical protein
MSTNPVTYNVWWAVFAAKNAVSSVPNARTPSVRAGSATRPVPWSTTDDITVAQPTPNARATCATEQVSCPTRRHASARARSVMLIRGRIASLVSVHVVTGHSRSRQRHTRLTHTIVTGRPAEGRSRTHEGRRSCDRACTPQPRQNASSATVSTACSNSPAYSDTANNRNPDNPSITVAAVMSTRTWDLH